MELISTVFLFENLFWTEARRDSITRQWLMENPGKKETPCDRFIECIKELLYGDIRFKMSNQLLTVFASEKFPILFRSLNSKELPYIFHVFRYRKDIFKTDKHLGAGMFSLEDSHVDHIIENIIPRKTLVVSYIKQALTIAGLGLKPTLHLAIRTLLREHATDAFLILLDNFFQDDEGDLKELNHLPGNIGVKPSKQKRSLDVNWDVIISDLMKKKGKVRSDFFSQKKEENPKGKRGALGSRYCNKHVFETQRKHGFASGYSNQSCTARTLLSNR